MPLLGEYRSRVCPEEEASLSNFRSTFLFTWTRSAIARFRSHLCRDPGRRQFRTQGWNFPSCRSSGSFIPRKRALSAIAFVQASSRNLDSRRSRMRHARGWRWSAARFVPWGSSAAGSSGPNYSCSTKAAIGFFRPN